MCRLKNPMVEEINKQIKQLDVEASYEKKLRKAGTPVSGGYMLTRGQMQKFLKKR